MAMGGWEEKKDRSIRYSYYFRCLQSHDEAQSIELRKYLLSQLFLRFLPKNKARM